MYASLLQGKKYASSTSCIKALQHLSGLGECDNPARRLSLSISISLSMPSIRKQEKPSRAGQQEGNNHEVSVQISTATPQLTARRSERIRGQELVKAREPSINNPIATENPSRTTRRTRARRGKPRKSDSERIDRSPIRKGGTSRGRDSVTALNLPGQNRTATGRTHEIIWWKIKKTSAPHASQGVPDRDPQTLQLYSVRLINTT
ncbi:hypothetical protein GGR58DRAFT_231773 [Xylaria digitata]|nr:hypothetical protein GGR58DRAFT_231773 [Xylaria digitata]